MVESDDAHLNPLRRRTGGNRALRRSPGIPGGPLKHSRALRVSNCLQAGAYRLDPPVELPGLREKCISRGAAEDAEMELDAITGVIVDASIAIHQELGPGLLEIVYAVVLASALERRGLRLERERPISSTYDGI